MHATALKITRSLGYLAAAIGLIFTTAEVRAVVIDDFQHGKVQISSLGQGSDNLVTIMKQTRLPTSSTLGGIRLFGYEGRPFGLRNVFVEVDPVSGTLTIETGEDLGYISLTYGSEDEPLGIDLRADGSDAFLLTFSEVVHTGPGPFLVSLIANNGGYMSEFDLANLGGSGSVRVPFPPLDAGEEWIVNEISLVAGRIPPFSRVVLSSIITVPPDVPPTLDMATDGPELQLRWSTGATGFVVESTPALGVVPWQTESNAIIDVIDDRFSVTLPTTEPSAAFRLRSEW